MNLRDWDRPDKAVHLEKEAIKQELILMEKDPELDTRISLVRADSVSVTLMSFQEKHLTYLLGHPKVDPIPYLMNLKTMIKIRKEK